MLENILKSLSCGNLSLRPFVVMADGSERALAYSVTVNEAARTATVCAKDGAVFEVIPAMSCSAGVPLKTSHKVWSASRNWASHSVAFPLG